MKRISIPAISSLCLTLLLGSISLAQERYVMPVDEAGKDPSFAAFRTKLIDAVKRKDAKYVLSAVDPKVRLDFGERGSIQQFKKVWKNLSPASRFWPEFLAVITNGGTFSTEGAVRFTAPYVFAAFPDDVDGTQYSVVFGKDVNLRSAPRANASSVATLSYNIVRIDHEASVSGPREQDEYVWYKIRTLGGKEGFVKSEFVRSAIDYRAIFGKVRGQWKLMVFVAGD